MLIQSRFRFWAFFTMGLLLIVTALLLFVVVNLLNTSIIPTFGVSVFFALFGFTWVWLVFGELRTKVVRITIEEDLIIVSNYFGLGTKKAFKLSEFVGFETALLPSRYDTYEYLYLIKDGKKAIKLSQFYHSNYVELKHGLSNKVENLGEKGFSLFQEIKEIFI